MEDMKLQRHRYTPEEDAVILSSIDQARQEKMDMDAVFSVLADKVGVGVAGLRAHVTKLRKKRKNGELELLHDFSDTAKLLLDDVSPRIGLEDNKNESIVDQVRRVVEERDKYKSLYQDALEELNAIRKLLR